MTAQAIFNFDAPAAREDKREAMERVDEHANEAWKLRMFEMVREVARSHREFTTDLPLRLYAEQPDAPRTHTDRAMGPLMLRAVRAGLVAKIPGRFVNSERRSCHNRPIQMYRSLIFEGTDA